MVSVRVCSVCTADAVYNGATQVLSQVLRAASAPLMSLQQHPTTCAKNAPKHAVASRANYARPKDDTLTSHLREAFKLLEGRFANCDHDSPEPITFSALERELPVAWFSDALFANTFRRLRHPPLWSFPLIFWGSAINTPPSFAILSTIGQ